MSADERTIMERLAEAIGSDDLSECENRCDADWLKALGVAGIRSPMGTALMDLDLSQNPHRVGPALAEVKATVAFLATRKGWALDRYKLRKISQEALHQYLKSPCKECKGRGMLGVDRAVIYVEVPCETCGRTGLVRSNRGIKTACPDCHGKATVTETGLAPQERPRPCPKCDGSGRRPIPCQHNAEIRIVLARMEKARSEAGLIVRKVLRVGGEVE